MERREFITTSAVSAAALLSGCSSLPNSVGGGSLPSYHTSIAAESMENSGNFVYLDMTVLQNTGYYDESTETPTESPTPAESNSDPATPLVTAPLIGSIFSTVFGLGFGLAAYGGIADRLNEQLDPESIDSEEDITMASVLFTPDAFVIEGEFDTEAYANDLPESFSEVDSRNGFTVYETDGDSPAGIAISSETLIFKNSNSDSEISPREAIGRVLDAREGNIDRFVDLKPDADWVLRKGGAHQFVIGSTEDPQLENNTESSYNPVDGTPLEDISTSVVVSGSSIQTSGGEVSGADADTALTHTDEPVQESAIQEAYADSEADISVNTSDGDSEDTQRVHINANFSSDPVQL